MNFFETETKTEVNSACKEVGIVSANPYARPRDFLNHHFVYLTISARARGLSVGVNMNPDKRCNFDCIYCEVNRAGPSAFRELDPEIMEQELADTLRLIHSGSIQELPRYACLPDSLLELKYVALSGDGEPTLAPNFSEAIYAVLHLRALGIFPCFKIVLMTNASAVDLPHVQEGIGLLTNHDEIWAKLDAGTPEHLQRVNRPEVPLETILRNIAILGRKRPVVIQSLFLKIQGQGADKKEIDAYADRLNELKREGAHIALVQIYSATRPTPHSECSHHSLSELSRIVKTVREKTGLRVELF